MSKDKRPTCTADKPAPPGEGSYARGVTKWNWGWIHADAVGKCIDDDHDDWLYICPYCDCGHIYEGPDA